MMPELDVAAIDIVHKAGRTYVRVTYQGLTTDRAHHRWERSIEFKPDSYLNATTALKAALLRVSRLL